MAHSLRTRPCMAHASVRAARSSFVVRPVVVRAADPENRGLSFTPSTQAAEGFVEKDTAGQSNMYPTYTRPFEAGSQQDTVQQETFNNGLAVGASVVSLGLIGVGLTVLVNNTAPAPVITEDFSQYRTLSEYASAFQAELKPAPALVELMPAPGELVAPPAELPVAVEAAAQ